MKNELKDLKNAGEKRNKDLLKMQIEKEKEMASLMERHRNEITSITNNTYEEKNKLMESLQKARDDSVKMYEKMNRNYEEILQLKATLSSVENQLPTFSSIVKGDKEVKKGQVFFAGSQDCLSNLWKIEDGLSVRIQNCVITFYSVEEAYQYQHAIFLEKYNIAEKIQRSKDSKIAFEESKKFKEFDNDEWNGKKENVMESLVKLKLQHCPAFKKKLMSTKGKDIVENTNDPFWGKGIDGKGLNKMEKILAKIRDAEMMQDDELNSAKEDEEWKLTTTGREDEESAKRYEERATTRRGRYPNRSQRGGYPRVRYRGPRGHFFPPYYGY